MKNKGFTLIEMLVVITILLILLGVLIPSLTAARENAKRGACRNNLKQVGLAFISYASDREGWFPLKNGGKPVYSVDAQGNAFLGGEFPFTQHGRLLFSGGYMRTPAIWVCPSDKGEKSATGTQLTVKPASSTGFDVSGAGAFASQGNCSYMYIAGYGDKFYYPKGPADPTMFVVLLDEANLSENGSRTPGEMPDIEADDNHGAKYRNVLYADGHVGAIQGASVANAAIFPIDPTDQHRYDKVNSID